MFSRLSHPLVACALAAFLVAVTSNAAGAQARARRGSSEAGGGAPAQSAPSSAGDEQRGGNAPAARTAQPRERTAPPTNVVRASSEQRASAASGSRATTSQRQ